MVALDEGGRPPNRDTLDHIRIQRALCEILTIFERTSGLLEDLDEQVADYLALLLRIGDASERGEEPLAGTHNGYVDAELLPEHGHDLACLAFPQQAVIDEDRDEVIANCSREKHSNDGRVDSATGGAHYFPAADELSAPRDLALDERARGPAGLAIAYPDDEILQNLAAFRSVRDLGMKLNAEYGTPGVSDRCVW